MTDSFTFCQLFLWVWVNDTSQPSPSGRYSFSGSVSVTTHHHIPSTEAVRLFCGSVRQRAAFTFPALSIVLVLVGHLYVLFSGLVGTTLLPSQHCSLGLLGQHTSTLPALFSGLIGTTLFYPPSTCSLGLWTTFLHPPSIVLWAFRDNTPLPSQHCSLGLLGQHCPTLPGP